MFGISLSSEYEQLCAAQKALERVREAAHRFADPHPVSKWSLARHAYHAALINTRMLGAARKLAEGDADVAVDGRANLIGWLVLTLGRMPRGKGRSPREFVPPEDLDDELLADALHDSRRQLTLLEPYLSALGSSEKRLPHPVLGALTPKQWLRAARMHAVHHSRIIADIEDLLNQSDSS